MTTEQPPDADRAPEGLDRTIIACVKATAGFGLAFAIGGGVIDGFRTGIGIGIGGLLATANLWAFAIVVRGVLMGGEAGKRWGMAGGLKFLALLGAAWLVLAAGVSTGLTLALGYGALPLGITIGGLFGPTVGTKGSAAVGPKVEERAQD